MSGPKLDVPLLEGDAAGGGDESGVSFTASDDPMLESEMDGYDVGAAIEAIGFGRFQWRLLFITGGLFMSDGLTMMQLSFLAPAAGCDFHLNIGEQALITSIVFIGMFIGSYVCGVASDKLGRRKVFLASSAWVAVFGILSAMAPNYGTLLLGQLFVGIGIGGVPVAFSLFTEFLPSESRGQQLVFIQGFWTIGVLAVALAAWVVMPILGWRWLLVISAIPNLLLCTQACLVPESPRYLGLKGDSDGAMRELQKAADYNGVQLPPGKLRVRAVRSDEEDITVLDLFKHDQAELTICIWALWFLVTLLYYGVILLTTEVFQSEEDAVSGCHKMNSEDYREVFITSCAEIPSLIAAVFMVEHLGRRYSLVVAFCGMAIGMVLLVLVADSRTGQAVMLFGSRGCANCAFTVIYIGTAEMYPTIYRTTGLGSASAMARIGGFSAPYIAQVMYDASPTVAILTMASFALLSAYIARMLPEVSGSLQDSCTPRSSKPDAITRAATS